MSSTVLGGKVMAPCFILAALLVTAAPATAQAWVAPKGEGTVWLFYQRSSVENHLFSEPVDGSDELDLGSIDSQTATIGADYSLTDRLAARANVSFITSRYRGEFAENPAIDDGSYHGTAQDASLEFRYLIQTPALSVTPFAGVEIPTHNYETFGHTAVGSNLEQYLAGVSLGRPWGVEHPVYTQLRYSYSFFERHEEHSMTRANLALDVAFVPTRWLALRAFGGWQRSYGGLDWVTDLSTDAEFHVHDELANANSYTAGGGAVFSVGNGIDLHVGYAQILRGENTHDAKSLIMGTSWTFGRGGRSGDIIE